MRPFPPPHTAGKTLKERGRKAPLFTFKTPRPSQAAGDEQLTTHCLTKLNVKMIDKLKNKLIN